MSLIPLGDLVARVTWRTILRSHLECASRAARGSTARGSQGPRDPRPAYSASPAVYTYRWAGVKSLPPTVVPVRISLGGPRFIPGAARFPAIDELMPRGLFDLDEGRVRSALLRAARLDRRRRHPAAVRRVARRVPRPAARARVLRGRHAARRGVPPGRAPPGGVTALAP